MDPRWHDFASPEQLAEQFAEDVANFLKVAISQRGHALLALSGGTTPAPFFRRLAQHDLDWSKVVVVPVDERFVPVSSERSNEKLIRDNLLTGKAADARFTPLYHDTATPNEAADQADRAVADLSLPFDVVVLGMGGDGHTASFFPDSPELVDVTDPSATRRVAAVTAPSADEPRLTLTLPLLLSAGLLALHIEGQEKRGVFEAALAQPNPQEKPISAVLLHAATPLHIYWAPKKGEVS
ncbi:6-phosphogluconolactonase [Tianweitania aestuarii]|uniref:6-phosphogluconolactonase n=1 Tax=Tianweitania aestuarii TaxID=2814886 RepID=UPI003D65C4EF